MNLRLSRGIISVIVLIVLIGLLNETNAQIMLQSMQKSDPRGRQRRQMDREKQRPNENCLNTEKGLAPHEKNDILKTFNQLRNQVASGNLKDFPRAAIMYKLVWDRDLEASAQQWAQQCEPKNSPYKYSGNKGETILVFTHPGGTKPKFDPIQAVEQKFHEIHIRSYDMNLLKSYDKDIDHTPNFNQIIWGETTKVGCGLSMYPDRSQWKSIFVCHFQKEGQIQGKPVYERGDNCQRCKCDMILQHLCENHKEY